MTRRTPSLIKPLLHGGIAVALAAVPSALAAQTGAFMNPASIDRAVAEHTGSNIGAEGGARTPIDRRLRLARCQGPLALAPYGRTQDSLQVSCPDAGGWRIFVPLVKAASAPAAQVLVAKGDRVSIVIEGRGFSVVQTGQALENGAAGDWVKVAPPGKSDTVRARVERPGRVVIPL